MKKRFGRTALAALVAGALVAPACLADMNVALNADVTLHGNFFTGGWGDGQVVSGPLGKGDYAWFLGEERILHVYLVQAFGGCGI